MPYAPPPHLTAYLTAYQRMLSKTLLGISSPASHYYLFKDISTHALKEAVGDVKLQRVLRPKTLSMCLHKKTGMHVASWYMRPLDLQILVYETSRPPDPGIRDL